MVWRAGHCARHALMMDVGGQFAALGLDEVGLGCHGYLEIEAPRIAGATRM